MDDDIPSLWCWHGTELADVLQVLEATASDSIQHPLRTKLQSAAICCNYSAVITSCTVNMTTQCLLQSDTPLYQAAAAGRTHMAELLIAAGADVTAKDNCVSEPCLSPSACTACRHSITTLLVIRTSHAVVLVP